MAGDQVAAKRVAEPQRPLEVNARAGLESTQGGQHQRLRAEIGRELPDRALDDGEAHAVDGDAGANRETCDVEDRPHHQPYGRWLWLSPRAIGLRPSDRLDGPFAFDDSREH